MRFLCRDPRPHTRIEYVERQGALTQHLIVERADVELRAQLPLRIATQRFYLELSTLVRQCLRRHHDVAIDFLDYVLLRLGAVRLAAGRADEDALTGRLHPAQMGHQPNDGAHQSDHQEQKYNAPVPALFPKRPTRSGRKAFIGITFVTQ